MVQFNLQKLRSIFILPVIIFLLLIPTTVLASFGIIFYTFSSHENGDFLWFENQYVSMGFPKNWYGAPLEYYNSTIGNMFSAIFFAPDSFLAIGLTIYDKAATQNFLNVYNFTDTRAILEYEANSTYQGIIESSSNATLEMVETGNRTLGDYEAEYSVYLIRNGYYENNVSKNLSFLTIFFFADERLVQIAYWGNEESFALDRQTFETVLSQMSVKT